MGTGANVLEMPNLPFQTPYDFSKIKGVNPDQHEVRFILEGANVQQALNDIELVCKQAKVKVNPQDIKFTAPAMSTSVNSNFTHLTFCKLTATGKTPAYPLRLYFTTSNDPDQPRNYYTGNIFYLKNGSLGKYAINRWKMSHGFTVDRTQYNGRMGITQDKGAHNV